MQKIHQTSVYAEALNGFLIVAFAVTFFQERPSVKRWVGLLVGIAAVVFLCNPF